MQRKNSRNTGRSVGLIFAMGVGWRRDKVYRESAQDVNPLWVRAFHGEPMFIGGEIGLTFDQKK